MPSSVGILVGFLPLLASSLRPLASTATVLMGGTNKEEKTVDEFSTTVCFIK